MQNFGTGYVFRRKFTTKCQSNQFRQQTVNLFTYKINVNVQFASVSLSVWKASEASKKFLKHLVLFVVL